MNEQEEKNKSQSFLKQQTAKGKDVLKDQMKKKAVKKIIATVIAPILPTLLIVISVSLVAVVVLCRSIICSR